MSERLYFNELHAGAPARKTKMWEVTATASDEVLGRILFHGAWRKFVFSPYDNTIFDHSCLREIADFSEAETKKWRESLKGKVA
jgi:hypothetical protein